MSRASTTLTSPTSDRARRKPRSEMTAAGVVVVDDGLLADILAGRPPSVVERASRVVTTSLWHYRLCRALLGDGGGALSRRFVGVSRDARIALLALPRIDVLGLASLAVDAAQNVTVSIGDRVVHLNALNAEAITVARATGGALVLGTESPNLRAAAGVVGLGFEVVGDRPDR